MSEDKKKEQQDPKAPEAPKAVAKGEPKPIKKELIEQQKDGSCEQNHMVGDEVKIKDDVFLIKEVKGKEIILAKKDFQ